MHPHATCLADLRDHANGVIEKDEFNKACSAGLVKADEATVKDMK
jgi:hypothetical protein